MLHVRPFSHLRCLLWRVSVHASADGRKCQVLQLALVGQLEGAPATHTMQSQACSQCARLFELHDLGMTDAECRPFLRCRRLLHERQHDDACTALHEVMHRDRCKRRPRSSCNDTAVMLRMLCPAGCALTCMPCATVVLRPLRSHRPALLCGSQTWPAGGQHCSKR